MSQDESVAASILIVEDDLRLAGRLVALLFGEGFVTTTVHNGREAIQVILRDKPDLVLLDIQLPGADGLTVLRTVRAQYSGRIILLPARDGEGDEVDGLDAGADDYIPKPLRPRKLLARIRTQLRRQEGDTVVAGPLVVHPTRRAATLDGEPMDLTGADFGLLLLLAAHAGRPVSRDAISLALIGRPYDGIDRNIDLRVFRLRTAIGDHDRRDKLIQTVRGVGYMLVRS